MQSRTSFFNKAVFLNMLRRFWPIWLVYLGVWMLAMPVSMVSIHGDGVRLGYNVLSAARDEGLLLSGVSAVLSAMAVWSFLYAPRSMSGLTCLPIRRERMFASATLAGIVPLLAANVLVALAIVAVGGVKEVNLSVYALQWFAIVGMSLVFYYGFATLCAQLTGNILVLPAVYAVLNFTAWAVESLMGQIAEKLIYGLGNVGIGISYFLSPTLALSACNAEYIREFVPQKNEWVNVGVKFEGWLVYGAYAIVGLLLVWGALALYRRRKMESVGDVVAIPVLKPIFKYCLTFGGALVTGWLLFEMLLNYGSLHPRLEALGILIFMLCGAIVGYFAAEMLNAKSFRVFRGHWRGFGISALVIVVLLGAVEFDLFGIERVRPDTEDVERVTVSASGTVEYDEAENIAEAIRIHGAIIDGKAEYESREASSPGHNMGEYVCFTYVLKNGYSFQREYNLRYDSTDSATYGDILALQELGNSREGIAERKDLPFEYSSDSVIGGRVECWLTAEQLQSLGQTLVLEDWILVNHYGYDPDYVEKHMSQEEKDRLLEDYYAYNDVDSLILSDFYNYEFTTEELHELYTQCILPDLADGRIGKIWIIDDENYTRSAYAATIRIEMRYERTDNYTAVAEETRIYYGATTAVPTDETEPYSYTFTIVPLVESSRTVEWLLAHGVILNTVETQRETTGTEYRVFEK